MRLDLYLTEHKLAKSRTKAKEYIEGGLVRVDGKVIFKASFEVDDGEKVSVDFSLDVKGKRCIDVGASTGGFTDVLLKRGAASVTCVDLGHGQLDLSLASDERVTNIEGCNARYMTADEAGDGYDVAVMDVSFISQTYIFPALFPLLCENGVLVTLVKPQFELERKNVGKGGIVKDASDRQKALLRVYDSALVFGYRVTDAAVSSIKGGDGNTEYVFLIERGEEITGVKEKLKKLSREK